MSVHDGSRTLPKEDAARYKYRVIHDVGVYASVDS
jgi:hypothetical protein